MDNFANNNFSPPVNQYEQLDDPRLNAPFNRATHPADKPTISTHIFAVDSRQRDYSIYPNANLYNINIPDRYRNVTGIELKAATLPRTEYNVNSANKYLDFVIGDFINTITLQSNNAINSKIEEGIHDLTIAPPVLAGGTQAKATVSVNKYSQITGITITDSGTGYSYSRPPKITLSGFQYFNVVIGFEHIGKMREGQYVIGGNPQYTQNIPLKYHQSWVPNNLVCEIENAMSNAILKDHDYCYSRKSWDTLPSGTTVTSATAQKDYPLLFTTRLMSQYPTLETFSSTSTTRQHEDNYNTNACKFNRMYFSNVLILKTTGTVSSGILDGTTSFTDSLGFSYIAKKVDVIPNTTSPQYILYCSLNNAIDQVGGEFWEGITEGPMDLGEFNADLCHWEFLFATGQNKIINSATLLGFNKRNYYDKVENDSIKVSHNASPPLPTTSTLIPRGLTYSTENDYYVFGDPEYIILSFRPKHGGNTFTGINDRIDSCENSNIDRVFACLIYDTVQPAVLQDVSSGNSATSINSLGNSNNDLKTFLNDESSKNDIQLLSGNSGTQNMSYNKPPGQLKAMKGSDFDRKIVMFPQPVAQIHTLSFRFSKFSKGGIGSEEELYDFHGKEHLMLFEITCSDLMTGKRF